MARKRSTPVVHSTKIGQMYEGVCDAILASLQPQPALNRHGEVIMIEGQPLMVPPSPAAIREAREMLKDNGIDSPPYEGNPINEVAKRLSVYDDEPDALLIESMASEVNPTGK